MSGRNKTGGLLLDGHGGKRRAAIVGRQGIEKSIRNPAFRPQAESLVNIYFDLIDEMAAELEPVSIPRGTLGFPQSSSKV